MKTTAIMAISVFMLMGTLSCEKETTYDFEAKVIYNEENILSTCQPQILFLEITKGLEDVRAIAGNSHSKNDCIYPAINIPTDLRKDGMMIKMNIRNITDDEMPGCFDPIMPVIVLQPILYVIEAEEN